MWNNIGFLFPVMFAVVTVVVSGYQIYKNHQQQYEQTQRDSERRRQRILTLEERLQELERKEKEEEARKRRRARDPSASSLSRRAVGGSREEVEVDPSSQIEELRSVIEDLEADRICLICYDKSRNVMFDCSHMVTCEGCAIRLEVCPICRSLIAERRTVRI